VLRTDFRFFAVVSEKTFEKTMKNPLFRAKKDGSVGIAQGRFLKAQNRRKSKIYSVVGTLSDLFAVLNKGGCFYYERK